LKSPFEPEEPISTMPSPVRAALTCVSLLVVACGKKDDSTGLAPAASALTASTADATSTAWHYIVDPKSSTHVDMPGVKEDIKGDTTGAAGALDVVARDLAQSRGLVRIDLQSFATHTFGNGDDAAQTKHALAWLEVTVGDKTSEEMRWADFAIRSIDGLSATDLTTVEPVKDAAEHDAKQDKSETRKVAMTVHGDVLVHGHRVQKDALVDVAFRYPSGSPADARPDAVEIHSKEPMHMVLKELDVRPRDPAGQLLDWTTKLISKVAETADVTVDLVATPTPATAGH
jgi:hypothetical protein